MKLLAIALASSLLLVGCGDDGSGGGDPDPESGTWIFTGGEIVDDSCEYPDPPQEPDGNFTLLNNGDGTFTVDADDGDRLFDCTQTGSTFNCPDRLYEDIDLSPLSGTVHIHVRATGSFASDTHASGRETADVSCTGADCATAAAAVGVTFPCSYSQDFTAEFSHL
jgi:hypothetical protein